MAGYQKYYERFWQYPRSFKNLDVDICHIIDQSDGYLSHWLNHYQIPNVVTCHDLINLIKPETFKGRSSFPLISMTAWKFAVQGMRVSNHVVAVSSHTKQDTVEHLGINPNRITVVPNAVDSTFQFLPQEKIDLFRQQQGVTPNTLCLLNVGSNNSRKNILTILKVIVILRAQDIPLLFWKVGADFNAEQKKFIDTHHLNNCVAHLGQPDKEMLVELYNSADILLAPSLYEGFGLTALEAMACGTAVITTNVTSIPEVVGNAAILTDPMDIDAISTEIQRLYHHPNERQDLVQRGLKRSKEFNWEDTAEQVANIYEQVLYKDDGFA
ncbi:glycosyltransferase family 1 protein [Acaryochloris marina]|uniref:glycosyltransferase family 4 protein n=1 Tax=Acaryochloris marina TaxID=155978 RepID=UPI002016AEA8|nr:glycosyltransferase family 1 protein [Acaryochloris marina]